GRVHRKVDGMGKQGFLDFLREQPFASDLRQRSVADDVTRGADHLDVDAFRRKPEGGSKLRAHHAGLGERERRAACPDPQESSLLKGSRPLTSQGYAVTTAPAPRS